MNIYSLPPLIVSILVSSIAIFVFVKNKRSVINITFSLLALSVSIWLFGYFIVYNLKDRDLALLGCKIIYGAAIFVPSFFYHFTVSILRLKNKIRFLILNYFITLVFFISIFFTDYLVSGVYEYSWGFQSRVGWLHNIFLLHFIGAFLISFIRIYSHCKMQRSFSPLEYNRLKYVLIAYIIASFGMLDVIPNYGIAFYPLFGPITITICAFILSFAILRFRLLNINIALTRASIFVFVYFLILGIPFGIGGLFKPSFYKMTFGWWLVSMFLMVILASLGPYIYMKIQRRIEARLRAQEFKSHEALRRLSHNMLRFRNLDALLKLIVHYLVKILGLRFAAIYLVDEKGENYVLSSLWPFREDDKPAKEVSSDSALVKDFILRHLPVVTEELKLFAPKSHSPHTKDLISVLSSLKANTVIPSFLRNDLLGFLVLSDRRKNVVFSQEDINLLMVLSNEAALAIENAQFHRKEKAVLAEKSRREALADMAPGASHQFNNRLASISSSAELLLLRLEDIKIDEVKDENVRTILKDAKETLETIDREVYKGKEITSAILKRAKAKVDSQEVDMAKLIENAYRLVLISHSKSGLDKYKGLKFKLNLLNEISSIFASEALLQDSFYNLIDNAFGAIEEKYKLMSEGKLAKDSFYEGRITVSLKQEDHILLIQVKDNGIGMAKDSKRKIFTPYFTTKATSNKGTGLGLYVIRDFIEMHQGSISCDSEYGEGTIFTIKLPIKSRRMRRKNV